MKRLLLIIKVLLFNIALLFAGLVIIELIFGNWFSPNRMKELGVPISVKWKMDVTDFYASPTPMITYTRDKYGLRGYYPDPSKIDLLTMGGSTTDQRFLGDGYTWQDDLDTLFRQNKHPIVIVNAGIDGQSTDGHTACFDWWFPTIKNFKPKFILFYVGINELCYESFHYDLKRAYGPFIYWRHVIWDYLHKRSVVANTVSLLWRTYQSKYILKLSHRSINFNQKVWVDKGLIQPEKYRETVMKTSGNYAERLSELLARCRKLGATPIFVSQPTINYRIVDNKLVGAADTMKLPDGIKFNGYDQYYLYKELNSILYKFCEERGLHVIKMGDSLDWSYDDFYDFVHMTPRGAVKFASEMYPPLYAIITKDSTIKGY